jgi:NAD(P) transhydrogenase subunit alpha
MIIGVLKETPPETRVSLTPEVVLALVKMGVTVRIEKGAGATAYYPDADYETAGAQISDAGAIAADADILLTIHPKGVPATVKHHAVIIGVFQPLFNPVQMQQWAERGLTVFSMDTIPRTTRAQSMDVLS